MKIIYICIALAILIFTGWFISVSPPCEGNYKFELGGDSYFLFSCENSEKTDTELTHSEENAIKVLSVDHTQGVVGKYFNFNVTEVDNFLKNQTWEVRKVTIKHLRTGKTGEVTIWRGTNGGSVGDGHGRWSTGSSPGQWETGDIVELIAR